MVEDTRITEIRNAIENYPDFPKDGIQFKDIFGVFKHPKLIMNVVDLMAERIQNDFLSNGKTLDAVIGLEARGFLFGPMLAIKMNCAFVPIRKAGKLPGQCFSCSYELEYGTATLEISKTALPVGASVVLVDDLLAIGGTLSASHNLVKKAELNLLGAGVLIELPECHGRKKLVNLGLPVFSLIKL